MKRTYLFWLASLACSLSALAQTNTIINLTPTILDEDMSGISYGQYLSDAGDVNGDGFTDVIVGAPFYENGDTNEGGAFLYLGSASGLSTTASVILESNYAEARFGVVTNAGDLNGDGYSDVAIGAERYDNGEVWEGVVFIYYGSSSGLNATPDDTLDVDHAYGRFGTSVSCAGDVNSDGYSDLIVGAPGYDSNGITDAGLCFVFLGGENGISSSPQAILDEATVSNNRFGISVSGAGDVNGDGYDDVLANSPFLANGENNEGITYLYLGSIDGVSSTAVAALESNVASAQSGWGLSSAGDVNNDGFDDIVIGAFRYKNGQNVEGGAFVYHGNSSGVSSTPAIILEVNQIQGFMGYSVSEAGDLNQDGYDDVLVGVRGYHFNTSDDDGAMVIYYGSASGLSQSDTSMISFGAEIDAKFGWIVSNAGDVNGDGYLDIASSTTQYDNGGTDEGGVFIFYGSAGAGSTNPLKVYKNDLVTPWSTNGSKCSTDFGVGLFATGLDASSSARLVVEYSSEGETFSSATTLTGSYTNVGLTGAELKLTVPLASSTRTYFRARVQFDTAAAIDSIPFSHWYYPQNQYSYGLVGGDVIRWDGSSWCNGSGVGNAPAVADSAMRLIVEGTGAHIDQASEIKDLLITEDASLTIDIDQCLTVHGASSNENTTPGSFVIAGNTTGRHGNYNGPAIENAEIQMGIASAGWHHISIPLDITAADWVTQNDSGDILLSGDTLTQNLWTYRTNTSGGEQLGSGSSHAYGQWSLVDSSDNVSSLGMAVYLDANYNGAPQVLSARGTTVEGDQSATLYNAYGGWNLIANPYPATLDLAAMYTANSATIDPGIHIWNATASNYASYDGSTGISTNNSNGAYLSIGQSAYVRPVDFVNSTASEGVIDNSTTQTLSFQQNQLSCNAVTLYKTTFPMIKLNARFDGSSHYDQVAIAFDPTWTDGYSKGEDIEKFFAIQGDVPGFYVKDQNTSMSIGKYNIPTNGKAIPLGLQTAHNGLMTIEKIESPNGWELFLTDHKEGKVTNLNQTDYTFLQDDADGSNRFELFVSLTAVSMEEVAQSVRQITCYQFSENLLSIDRSKSEWEEVTVEVLDIHGRSHLQTQLEGAQNIANIEVQLPTGVYLIRLINIQTQEETIEKIIWRQ